MSPEQEELYEEIQVEKAKFKPCGFKLARLARKMAEEDCGSRCGNSGGRRSESGYKPSHVDRDLKGRWL